MTLAKKRLARFVILGTATKLTKGSWGPYSDEQLMQLHPGLSRD